MECKFVVDQRVVCIAKNLLLHPNQQPLSYNKVYTIRRIIQGKFFTADGQRNIVGTGILLNEIINPKIFGKEPCYNHINFIPCLLSVPKDYSNTTLRYQWEEVEKHLDDYPYFPAEATPVKIASSAAAASTLFTGQLENWVLKFEE